MELSIRLRSARTPLRRLVCSRNARRQHRRRRLVLHRHWLPLRRLVECSLRRALVERHTSLLPAGVVSVTGTFDEESIIDVVALDGTVLARGMSMCDAATVRSVMGKRTADLPAEVAHEVVHRDDLILLVG